MAASMRRSVFKVIENCGSVLMPRSALSETPARLAMVRGLKPCSAMYARILSMA